MTNDTGGAVTGGNTNIISPPQTSVSGVTSISPNGLISQAEQQAQALRTQLDRQEALIQQQRELQARAMLGGSSTIPQPGIEITPQQAKKEAAAKFFEGTQLSEIIKKRG